MAKKAAKAKSGLACDLSGKPIRDGEKAFTKPFGMDLENGIRVAVQFSKDNGLRHCLSKESVKACLIALAESL